MASDDFSTCFRASDTPDAQAEWGGLLAKIAGTLSHIRCFSWDHWSEDSGARGLLAADGQAKPLLFRLRHLRTGFAS